MKTATPIKTGSHWRRNDGIARIANGVIRRIKADRSYRLVVVASSSADVSVVLLLRAVVLNGNRRSVSARVRTS